MFKRSFLVLALALAACDRGPAMRPYVSPDGDFSMDVPADWTIYSNLGTDKAKPIGYVFVAPGDQSRIGGEWHGSRIAFYKFHSRRSDFKGSDDEFDAYRLEHLAPAQDLYKQKLPQTSTLTVAGLPARSFVQPYRLVAERGKEEKGLDQMLEQVLFVRPEAVYMLEFRSTPELFSAHESRFRALLRSFKFQS